MSLWRLSIRTVFVGGIAAFHRLRCAGEDLSRFLACAQTRPALPFISEGSSEAWTHATFGWLRSFRSDDRRCRFA